MTENLCGAGELAIIADGDGERPIRGLEHFVRHERRVTVAHAARHGPRHDVRAGLIRQRRQQGRQQRHLDELPLPRRVAMPQRREHADGSMQTGDDVDERDADLRRLAGRPGHRHEATDGLHEQVVPGQRRLTETGDRYVDDVRVPLAHLLIPEPQPRHRPRQEILDDDVGARHEIACGGEIVRLAKIPELAALVAVDRQEVRRLPVLGERRTPGARVVTAVRALDLDDVGAQVAEQHRRVRAGQDAAEVGDEQAVES